MSDFMIVNSTRGLNYLNLGQIEKVKTDGDQAEVWLSSGDHIVLSESDSRALKQLLNNRAVKQAAA